MKSFRTGNGALSNAPKSAAQLRSWGRKGNKAQKVNAALRASAKNRTSL